MGMTIKSRVPRYDAHRKFFFDEEFMAKCAQASSAALLEKCAGKEYYKFVLGFFEEQYILYDNGFEGIRNGCIEVLGRSCKFHSNVKNQSVLNQGWCVIHVQRVQLPPVPDYKQQDGFRYCQPSQITGNQMSEFDTCRRKIDDYNPQKNIEKLLASCGAPSLKVEKSVSDYGSVVAKVVGTNNTLGKALEQVKEFVTKYTGAELESAVVQEIQRKSGMKVKSEVSKKLNADVKAAEKAKSRISIGVHLLEITSCKNCMFLSWIFTLNKQDIKVTLMSKVLPKMKRLRRSKGITII